MGRKKSKAGKGGKGKSIKAVMIVDDERATPERALKTFTGMTGKDYGSGLELRDAELTAGGTVLSRAHHNAFECLLDIIRRDGILRDSRDDEAESRRYLAGLSLRYLYERAEIEADTTAVYEKMGGGGSMSGPPRKSQSADKAEDDYNSLMRKISPYHIVVRDICCRNEDPRRQIAPWDETLRRGLDLLADALYGKADGGRRRIR